MMKLERRIRTAQHRLWLNRWLDGICRSVAIAAAGYACIVLIQRLFDAPVPLFWVGVGLGAGAVLWSIVGTIVKREDAALAAATLDEAAGLRERLGSGHYCQGVDDPFARAVVADAERASASLSARQHIRLTVPPPLALTTGSILVAALTFLLSPGLLTQSEATEAGQQREELARTKVAVKQKLDAVRRMAERVPVLEELKKELEGLDKRAGGALERPADIRHEAIKKIDNLADAVKNRRNSTKYGAVKEMRKMLRGLKVPQAANAPTQKLAKALAQGDFKAAKEEIQALKEQLATLKSEQDKQLAARLSKQLEDLAKQLETLARNERLATKLPQASSVAKRLAEGMQRGAQAVNSGRLGEALAGLSLAGQQLSELEQLEQEMNQLESALAVLREAQDSLGKPCSACADTGMQNGQPCRSCRGRGSQGSGMGPFGQGRGGLAPQQQTNVGFKIERGKVHTGKGAIIGQFLVDGEQVKGEVDTSFAEIVSAAEREASDRINRGRIPRQYHKAVKSYFSSVQRSIQRLKSKEHGAPADAANSDAVDDTADHTRDDTEEKE